MRNTRHIGIEILDIELDVLLLYFALSVYLQAEDIQATEVSQVPLSSATDSPLSFGAADCAAAASDIFICLLFPHLIPPFIFLDCMQLS